MDPRALYRQQSVESLSGPFLILKAYDGILSFLHQADTAIQENHIEVAHKHLSSAQDVVAYLHAVLDMEKGGDVARSLATFYADLRKLLEFANLHKSREAIEQAISQVADMRGVWQKAISEQSTLKEGGSRP